MKKPVTLLVRYGLPIALSVLLVYYFYKNVDLAAIGRSMTQDVNYWWFVPVIAVSVASHVFRAMRWRLQLVAIGVRAPLHVLVVSIFGTYFMNLLVPRLGEVWRSGYVANRQKASFTKVVGSMVGDRLADTLTVLLLTAVTFFLAQGAFMRFFGHKSGSAAAAASVYDTWWFWALVLLCGALVALMVWIYRSTSRNGLLGKMSVVLHNLADGLMSVVHMRGKWMFLLYTVLIWGCYFLQLLIASQAFSYTRDLGVVPVLVLFVFSSLGMAVPTNGGVGAWQYAIMFGLAIYGVGTLPLGQPYDAQASTFAWLVWGVQQLLIVALGIYTFVFGAIDRHRIATGRTVVDTCGESLQI